MTLILFLAAMIGLLMCSEVLYREHLRRATRVRRADQRWRALADQHAAWCTYRKHAGACTCSTVFARRHVEADRSWNGR